jgi:hypothetical protein
MLPVLRFSLFDHPDKKFGVSLFQLLSSPAMKKRVIIFLAAALLMLAIFPAINLAKYSGSPHKNGQWWKRSALYNSDFAVSFLGRQLYTLGISTSPHQVIIGKDGWLYLGDQYENTITAKRRSATSVDIELAEKTKLAMQAWDDWLRKKRVRRFQIMLAPDKETIYPEFLPRWAQAADNSAINAFLATVGSELYFDTRPALHAARSRHSIPLYFKTDTHWNKFGAWIAFHAFTREIARTEPALQWLSDQQIAVSPVKQVNGGDLAMFLRMANVLPDHHVGVRINGKHPIETEQYDFETGQLKFSGGNPFIDSPQRPLLVKSKYALNKRRVLWLRDSFGTAMAPFMAATFADVVQMHYGATDSFPLTWLVDTYKPDYIFITVVEREARGGWFRNFPPIVSTAARQDDLIALGHGTLSGANHMTKAAGGNTYSISGDDPFVTFALNRPVKAHEASQLVFQLDCGEEKAPVKIQMFWRTTKTDFSESSSVRFVATPGVAVIDLSELGAWKQADAITDLRIDIDSPQTCSQLALGNLELARRR